MNLKIVFALALVAIVAQVDAACLCNFGEGIDMCGTSESDCQSLVVRPAILPKLNFEDFFKPRIVCRKVEGLPRLLPIEGPCSCREVIVVPAVVPRPKCPCKELACDDPPPPENYCPFRKPEIVRPYPRPCPWEYRC